jgi:hypothetical protein
MQQIPAVPQFHVAWSVGAVAVIALVLAALALIAVATVLVSARQPILRWERIKSLALFALCVVPALAVVAFIGYFAVVPHPGSTAIRHHESAKRIVQDSRDTFRSRTSSNGLVLGYDDKQLVVLSSRAGSPAELAGLKEGDAVLSVNGSDVGELGPSSAASTVLGRGLLSLDDKVELQVRGGAGEVRTIQVNMLRPIRKSIVDGAEAEIERAAAQLEQAGDQASALAERLAAGLTAQAECPAGMDQACDPQSSGFTGTLHVQKTEKGAPDWAEKDPVATDDGVLVALSSQRFATLAEAEQQVTSQAASYIKNHYRDEYPLSGDWTVPVSLIEKHAVREFIGEEFEKDFGKMYRAHLRISLDSNLRRAVHGSWRDQIALHRLGLFGGALGAATLLLATCAGYFKLDDLTGGQYRRRLKLAAAALLAAGGLTIAVLA